MPIHTEVLTAAQRVCRDDWTFRPVEVVRALPHLNAQSVRTHLVSRCCENAPEHHVHRWPYFRRVRRGVYEILPPYRLGRAYERAAAREPSARTEADTAPTLHDAEVAAPSPAIHAFVTESEGWFVVECVEVAVVAQGRSLDEMLENLRDALALHLDDDERARAGLPVTPRVVVNYETLAPTS